MKTRIETLLAGISVVSAAGCATPGAGDRGDGPVRAGRQSRTFTLQCGPIPAKKIYYGLRRSIYGVHRVGKPPPGFDAVEPIGRKIRLGQVDPPELRHVILGKSDKQQKRHDRLYIDANGNGRFDPAECYDISRVEGPVKRERSDRVAVYPVKVVVDRPARESVRWIKLTVYEYDPGKYNFWCSDFTCAVGGVKIGDKDMLLAVYDPEASRSPDRYDRRLEWGGEAGTEDGGVRWGCQLLLDVNGNGRFDDLGLDGVGAENQWLTSLIRLDGKYYGIQVAPDGTSVRITPSDPEVGWAEVPETVEYATILGPAFAANVTERDRRIELPSGLYAVSHYQYRSVTGSLRCRYGPAPGAGWQHDKLVIKPGQTTLIRVGLPLEIRVTCGPSRAERRAREAGKVGPDEPVREFDIAFGVMDCVGRRLIDLRLGKKGRPPPPYFTITDEAGKTILNAAFKYG